MRRLPARSCPVAAPLPSLGFFNYLCAHRIQDDVSADFEKMAVFLYKNGLVAALEKMTRPTVESIEQLRVHAVQLPHAESQIAVRRLDEEMIMVVHEAVGMTDPIVAFVHVLKGVQEPDAVLVAFEDRLPLITARSDVVNSTGIFNS